MRRITALVKPNMLEDVVFALHELQGFPGATISEVQKVGSGGCEQGDHGTGILFHDLPRLVRMEIVCSDGEVDAIVNTIINRAHTGLPDDGAIYICDVKDVIHIRTGQHGQK